MEQKESPTWGVIHKTVELIDKHIVEPAHQMFELAKACKESVVATVAAWEAGRKAAK